MFKGAALFFLTVSFMVILSIKSMDVPRFTGPDLLAIAKENGFQETSRDAHLVTLSKGSRIVEIPDLGSARLSQGCMQKVMQDMGLTETEIKVIYARLHRKA